MELSEQVVSLDLAKRLKELGVKQESSFYYDYAPHVNNGKPLDDPIISFWRLPPWCAFGNRPNKDDFVSAFTVAELGELLPDWQETVKRADKDWVCIIRHKNSDINDHSFAQTEADARAKMLIHLIENKLMDITNDGK